MATAGAVDLHGDPKDLLERYENASQAVVAAGGMLGLVAHYCLETDFGIRVMTLFETEDQVRAFYARPIFRKALSDAGLEFQEPAIMPVHNYRQMH
jgi:hypothetical protein